jgi:hypothetical protein
MSASLRERLNCCSTAKCRDGPQGDICSAESGRCCSDHLVGAREHGRRRVEVKRGGGDQIDGQIELGRLYHRQVTNCGHAPQQTGGAGEVS